MNRGSATDLDALGDCPDQIDESGPCLCELQYELEHGLVDHRPEHERWLFEWCLECLDLEGIRDVTVDRHETDERTSITLQIETLEPCSAMIQDEKFGPLLERLERWIGEFTIRCGTTP